MDIANPLLSDDAYNRWRQLYMERERAGPEMQNILGPREHGAYSEMRVIEHPLLGPIEQLVAIPGYTAAKALGIVGGRSDPGVDEMAEAYRGLGRGLLYNAMTLRGPADFGAMP